MTLPLFRNGLLLFVCGAALLLSPLSHAQTPVAPKAPPDNKPAEPVTPRKPDPREFVNPYPADWAVKTYFLHNVATQNDANEILVALRNTLLPSVHIFLVSSENAIVLYGPPEQHQVATNLIRDLDRPKQSYKLTYTLNESDAGKRVGTQHFSMFLVSGQRTTLKQGSKVPLLTGTYSAAGSSSAQQQFQYIDVGMNFDAMIDPYAGGLRLRSKVEQSSTTEDKTISGTNEPLIRQSVLEGVATLVPGKSVTLGSVEVTGTTRRIDIDVIAEPMP